MTSRDLDGKARQGGRANQERGNVWSCLPRIEECQMEKRGKPVSTTVAPRQADQRSRHDATCVDSRQVR
jgi:hypothetical protein